MFTVESPKSVSCDAMTNVAIVDIVSLKFASDEAAGWKVDILEPLFYSQ